MDDVVHLVMSPGIVHAAYWRRDVADRHQRAITGVSVVSVEVRNDLPPEIVEDLTVEGHASNGDDFEGDTPVIEMKDIDDAKK